jgi:hypothetical protein
MIRRVEISRLAAKQLRKVPRHVVNNLMIWVLAVEQHGLEEVRKVRGYHDEPL